jgi:hypothetical protein
MNGPALADTPQTRRARYRSGENGLDSAFPDVPIHQFLAEPDRAFDPVAPTDLIALDVSEVLDCDYEATTPTLLCRHVRLRAGEPLATEFVASGEIFHVMHSEGEGRNGADTVQWRVGDVFCFPGGGCSVHCADGGTGILLSVTNEPLLPFENLCAPLPGQARIATTHRTAEEIDRRFQAVWARPMTEKTTGASVQFTSAELAPSYHTILSINCTSLRGQTHATSSTCPASSSCTRSS